MKNELTIVPNESMDMLIAKLNKAAGFNQSLPIIPMLKYDASTGMFMRETGEKNDEGKSVYEPIGEKIEVNIVLTRKMAQTDFNDKNPLFSREFSDNFVRLYNDKKEIVMEGLYKELKAKIPTLVYVQVLYVMFEDKPYRMKLSGTKLASLFPYMQSFVNDTPARYMTVMSKGAEMVNGAIKYFELNINRGDEIVDMALVCKRVNDMNFYLETIRGAMNDDYAKMPDNSEPLPEYREYVDENSDKGVYEVAPARQTGKTLDEVRSDLARAGILKSQGTTTSTFPGLTPAPRI